MNIGMATNKETGEPSFMDWLHMLFRLFVVIGIPLTIAFFGYAIKLGTFATEQFIELQADVAEIRTGLLVGIEPRVSRLESELTAIKGGLAERTQNRFTDADAKKLEAQIEKDDRIAQAAIQRELDRIYEVINELKQKRGAQ